MDTTMSDVLIGRTLDGRYRVESRIARGGMATVYRALDTRLDRVVALKVMHQLYADNDQFVTRFIREAKSAAKLSHPNVVAVFDQGDDDGYVFLAMEYVHGQTLRDLLRARTRLLPQEALAILEPVLAALGAAHAAGLVHRDVKPENVLLADDGRVKVADFGLARAAANLEATSATTLIGTVAYLAPEQVIRGIADPRSDVYAAGIMLFEMLTGRPPYDGETAVSVALRHAHEDVPPPSSIVPSIPPSVDMLVARSTARDPDRRPVDASAFLADTVRVRRSLPPINTDAASQPAVPLVNPTLVVELPEAVAYVAPSWLPPAALAAPMPAAQIPAAQMPPVAVSDRRYDDRHDDRYDNRDDDGYDDYDDRRPRRHRRGWIALLIVLLLAVGAAGAGWWYAAGRWATTPSLYQLTAQTAVAKGKSAGVNVVIGTTTNSAVVPIGEVVEQSPGSNHRLLRGGTVTVHLSSGPVHYSVPAFTAGTTTYGQYQAALSAVHLTWVEAPPQNDPTIPAGDVLSVTPAPGASLVANTPVTVTVSSGPAPIAITDYTGKPATQAETALTALGFSVPTPTQDYSTTVPAGSVISQSPDTGTAQAGALITLDVSKGPQLIAVPNVTNEKTAAAEATLTALGFKYFLVRAPFGPGVVYQQSPAPGSMKPPGTTVTLDIL